MAKTRLSSKGWVVIPKALRDRHGWRPGTELEIEDRRDAVLLRARAFPRTSVAQVFGCLGYGGPALTVGQMGAAVAREARKVAPARSRSRRRGSP